MNDDPRITLGPVPSSAARAFVGFARDEVARLADDPVLSLTFTPQIVQSMRALFDAWSAATATDPFEWSGTLPTDHAEYLLYALFLGMEHRRATLGGVPSGPEVDARRPFVVHLIERFTMALAATPDADHARLEHLTERWPPELRPPT